MNMSLQDIANSTEQGKLPKGMGKVDLSDRLMLKWWTNALAACEFEYKQRASGSLSVWEADFVKDMLKAEADRLDDGGWLPTRKQFEQIRQIARNLDDAC